MGSRNIRLIERLSILTAFIGIASSAHAGPAMFSASMIIDSFGNDVTSGATYPYNELIWVGMPLGHDCQDAYAYTPNGVANPRYCARSVLLAGYPATGSGTLLTGGATLGAPVGLPQSGFGVDVTGFNRTYYPYLQSNTYGDFVNAAGTFFPGAGPAFGKGTVVKSGMGQTAGTFVIHEGDRGFGGAFRLLGAIGAKRAMYVVPGKPGTYVGSYGNWAMVTPLGRMPYATPTGYTAMGKTLWANPHTETLHYTNNVNGNTSEVVGRVTGTPWTTGSVAVYVQAGLFQTILRRAGHDSVTTGGVRNLQLVTPSIGHWIAPGWQTHTGQIGILTLQIVPEPGAILLFAAGSGLIALLYRLSRRR